MPSVEQGSLKAADDKTDLYYRLVKPTDFNPTKKYPAIIYVYGGPHSQLVSNRWRFGSDGWETYMAQKGYMIFVMDNRGTSYRGADFENITHRYLGGRDKRPHERSEFLCALPMWTKIGWVFMVGVSEALSINMLLRHPDTFADSIDRLPIEILRNNVWRKIYGYTGRKSGRI